MTGNGKKQYAAPRGGGGVFSPSPRSGDATASAAAAAAAVVESLAATPAHGTRRMCLAFSESAIAVARGPPS